MCLHSGAELSGGVGREVRIERVSVSDTDWMAITGDGCVSELLAWQLQLASKSLRKRVEVGSC